MQNKNVVRPLSTNGIIIHFNNHKAQLFLSTWKKYVSAISHNIGSSYLYEG